MFQLSDVLLASSLYSQVPFHSTDHLRIEEKIKAEAEIDAYEEGHLFTCMTVDVPQSCDISTTFNDIQ